MKTNNNILFLFLLILILIGCQKPNIDEKPLVIKEYGIWNNKSDSLGVELEYNHFKNWKDLIERTERIACNDSLPKITLRTNNELNIVYFQNPCWEDFACILIKERNVIQIHNDTIKKYDNIFPIDSIESVLRRDVENNGMNPKLSDNPQKLLISISYDSKSEFKEFPIIISKLTQAYERITNKTDIVIWLEEKFNIPLLPPPPKEQQENKT